MEEEAATEEESKFDEELAMDTTAAAAADSFKYRATCLLMVEFLGPLSCCTASRFIPASAHFEIRQALH